MAIAKLIIFHGSDFGMRMIHRVHLAQFFKECLAKEDLIARIFEGEQMLYNPTQDDEGDLEDRGESVLAEGHKRKREDEDSVSGEGKPLSWA